MDVKELKRLLQLALDDDRGITIRLVNNERYLVFRDPENIKNDGGEGYLPLDAEMTVDVRGEDGLYHKTDCVLLNWRERAKLSISVDLCSTHGVVAEINLDSPMACDGPALEPFFPDPAVIARFLAGSK